MSLDDAEDSNSFLDDTRWMSLRLGGGEPFIAGGGLSDETTELSIVNVIRCVFALQNVLVWLSCYNSICRSLEVDSVKG